MSEQSDTSVLQATVSPMIDVAQAAARLGVSVRYVRRLVSEQRLPYIKVGKFVRFDVVELERWIDDRRVEAKYRRPV